METTATYEWHLGTPGADLVRPIREEVFIQEQGFSNEFDEIDAIAWHARCLWDGELAGTIRVFAQPGQPGWYHLGRLCVKCSLRGEHLGAGLMQQAEQKVRELGGTAILLSAQTHARPFYEKLGYTAHGEEYLDEHCPHIEMRKILE